MKSVLVPATAVAVALLSIMACGPGRQAAWEQQGSQEMSATPSTQSDSATPEDLATQADEAWGKREDKAELEKAISLWEQALQQKPGNGEILTHLARAYYFLADGYTRGPGTEEAQLAIYEKGILAGENAMMGVSEKFAQAVRGGAKVEEAVSQIGVDGQDAVYWYASNLGKFAVAKGFTTTLFYKDRIFAVMQHVLTLDETYFHGAPHRYFGAFYAKAPAFAGGDMTKSKEHFDKSIEIAGDYFGTKVLYAQYYAAKADDKELYTRLLNEVISGDPNVIPEIVAEQKVEQQKAKEMLAKVAEVF